MTEDEARSSMYEDLSELISRWRQRGISAAVICGRLLAIGIIISQGAGCDFDDIVNVVKHYFGREETVRPKAQA